MVTGLLYDGMPLTAAFTGVTETMLLPADNPVSVRGLDVPVTLSR